MATRHGENACVHPVIERHGGRRRRCVRCGVTWSVWKHRRGRKRRPRRLKRLRRTFLHNLTVSQQAFLSGQSYETTKARHRRALESLARRSNATSIPRGPLILVLDGLWFRINGKRWTVYLMALRSVSGKTARFLHPIIRRENESATGWERAVSEIPPEAARRIIALVSDGLRGLRALAKRHDWQYQWCHFHLLGRLANVCGTRKRTLAWLSGRRRVEACIRELISTRTPQRVQALRRSLAALCRGSECPRKIRMIIREVLRHTDELRAYLDHPELRLPTTSNIMESLNSRLRDLAGRSRGFRTGVALARWIIAYIYFHSKSVCRPKNPQN